MAIGALTDSTPRQLRLSQPNILIPQTDPAGHAAYNVTRARMPVYGLNS